MESLQVIDIIYQFISENGEKNEENFVIPDINRNILSYKAISCLLAKDDVDISKICHITYYNEYKCEYIPLKSIKLSKINPSQQKLKLLIYLSNTINPKPSFGNFDSSEMKLKSIQSFGSSLNLLELYSKKNTKATGILTALKHLGIPVEQSYAFGDGKNDIEMLSTVGCGIAMGNASDEVKSYAHQVTDSVLEDGVATGIEKYILI